VNTGDALIGKPSFLPYAEDVAPSRVNALSVFTPGGDLKSDIDVNAITPSPTTLPAPSDVSTALNQEVPVGLPDNNDPSFLSRLGDFFFPYGVGGVNRPTPELTQEGTTQPPTATAQSFFGQAPASNAAEAAQRLIDAGPAFTQAQTPAQAPALDPTSDEAILARRAEREAQFSPQGPMGQDATRARLGGMTLNEYLNAPAGTPGVSGLRTDAQGRMITPAAPVSVNNFAPQASGSQVGPAKVPDEIMSQVVRTGAQTAEFRDGNRDGIEDREQGIFRPGELLGYDAQGNEVRAPGTQQPVNRIPATTQPPVDALSSFERDSLARQQRIGGTGSFAGDSAAREARLRANERLPGETQTERDTRIAQSRTTGGQTEGLSFDDARRRAEGELAERGVRNPSASQVNALARLKQAEEPERLAELETQRAKDAAELKTAQATLDRPEFEGKVYTVNGVTFAQTSRGGAQVIDTGAETAEESTANMKDFVFTLEQIDKAREAYSAGDVARANDILTAAGIQKNGIDVTANEYFGNFSPQVPPAGSTPQVTDTQFDPSQLTGQDREAYNFAINNPNDERSQRILNKLGAN
jgi:hypothetical protein